MCGIVGYIGCRQAAPILLEGLKKLEYRGYDSAGIAVRDVGGEIEIVKAKGRLKMLNAKVNGGLSVKGNCGIGHTRWATHGEPSEENAHPHASDDRRVVAVHNGIIENYSELKEKLVRKGYKFYSDTDTEVATKLIHWYYAKFGNPIDALAQFELRAQGSYAIAVMFKDYPEEIYVARKDCPMIIGVGDGQTYLASDVPAILKYTRSVYYVDNLEIARLTKGAVTFYNIDKEQTEKQLTQITWDAEAAEKGGFEHFMMKEIYEQPSVVRNTVNCVLRGGKIDLSEVGITDGEITNLSSVTAVACGSAYHVCVAAQYVFEDIAKIPVRAELASEFRYRKPLLDKNDLVIIVSQSGETADSLAALREAKKLGAKTLAVVNVVGSSIAREADGVFYIKAGPEISVATTKAYSAQLVAAYLLAVHFGYVRKTVDEELYAHYVEELRSLPEKIERILEDKEKIQWFASKAVNAKDAFFIGRGEDYAACLEGSLKLKEISYIHSEAYAAGELKHGTISLIEDGTLVCGVLTQSALIPKTLSNMEEVKTRGGYLMAITTEGNYFVENKARFTVYVPATDEHFTPSLTVIPMQLFAYYVSVGKGLDVDNPRNLAKSVTVE